MLIFVRFVLFVRIMRKYRYVAKCIHGDRRQEETDFVLQEFRSDKIQCLVASRLFGKIKTFDIFSLLIVYLVKSELILNFFVVARHGSVSGGELVIFDSFLFCLSCMVGDPSLLEADLYWGDITMEEANYN